MRNRFLLHVALAGLALSSLAVPLLVASPAAAQRVEPVTRLGSSGTWEAYEDAAPGGKICFLVGKPARIDKGHGKPDDVRMSVTHRPADKVANVVNFILGYRAKPDSDALLDIDGRKFPLFTNKDGAWTRDAQTDKAVVRAMTRGRSAVIKAEPERGTPTADTYDLTGFTSALDLIDKACGIRR